MFYVLLDLHAELSRPLNLFAVTNAQDSEDRLAAATMALTALKQHPTDMAVADFSMRALVLLAGEQRTASSLIRSQAVSIVRDSLLNRGDGHNGDKGLDDEAVLEEVGSVLDDLDVQDQGCRLLEALAMNGGGTVDILCQGAMTLLVEVLSRRGDSDGRVKQQCCAAISGMLNTLPPHLPYVASAPGACLSVIQDAGQHDGSRPGSAGRNAKAQFGEAGSTCGEVEGRFLVNALSDAVRSHPYEVV